MKTWEIILLVILVIIILVGVGFLIYDVVVHVDYANINVCPSTPVTAPSNVLATVTSNLSISVTWQGVPGVDSYNIYLSQTPTFTASGTNFVMNVAQTASSATIGPYKNGTYYVQVASIKGSCRSDAVPSAGAKVIVTTVTPQTRTVRIRIDKQAYNINGCNNDFFANNYYIERTNNGCVTSNGGTGRADFGLNTDNAADLNLLITDETQTFIRLASDPTKYLGVTIVGGNNHACFLDASQFSDSSKITWMYNNSTGTLGLADGSAILIGYVSVYESFVQHHLYGPYVVSTTSPEANCPPSSTCSYSSTCVSGTTPSIIYIKWVIEDVSS